MSNNALLPTDASNTVTSNENGINPSAEVIKQFGKLTAPFFKQQAASKLVQDFCNDVQQMIEDIKKDDKHFDEIENSLIDLGDKLLDYLESRELDPLFLCKNGGLDAIKSCLDEDLPYPIKIQYLDIIGNISQNKEDVQNYIYENSNFIPEFLQLITKEGYYSSEYCSKLLFAISTLVRGNNKGRKLFFENNGVDALETIFNKSFNDSDIRVSSRSTITAYHIYCDARAIKDENADERFKNLLIKMKSKLEEIPDKYEDQLQYLNSEWSKVMDENQ